MHSNADPECTNALISTKASFATGEGPNDKGSSRFHLIEACEASLKRLGTDHIDLYFMHGFDELTPVEEVLRALDQGLGTMVWSPLGWGRLTGKIRRGEKPGEGRIKLGGDTGGPIVDDKYRYDVVDAMDEVAEETGKTIPQIVLNWLLQRPGVSNIVIGARNEKQLKQNLGAVGWNLTAEQVGKLDAASQRTPIYPYWHQRDFDERIPSRRSGRLVRRISSPRRGCPLSVTM